jgi:hypothetical protein
MTRTAEVDGMKLTMPVGWWVWDYDKSDFHKSSSKLCGWLAGHGCGGLGTWQYVMAD